MNFLISIFCVAIGGCALQDQSTQQPEFKMQVLPVSAATSVSYNIGNSYVTEWTTSDGRHCIVAEKLNSYGVAISCQN